MRHALLSLILFVPSLALAQSPTSPPVPPDARTTPEPTFVIAKWKAKFYGFAELDTMADSTQSFAEIQGNGIIVKPGTT